MLSLLIQILKYYFVLFASKCFLKQKIVQAFVRKLKHFVFFRNEKPQMHASTFWILHKLKTCEKHKPIKNTECYINNYFNDRKMYKTTSILWREIQAYIQYVKFENHTIFTTWLKTYNINNMYNEKYVPQAHVIWMFTHIKMVFYTTSILTSKLHMVQQLRWCS